jgi:hypothetical protein
MNPRFNIIKKTKISLYFDTFIEINELKFQKNLEIFTFALLTANKNIRGGCPLISSRINY